jgi:hypothetical protein
VSASLSSSLILALSIEACGRVFSPVAAQSSEMFCETMPASRAFHSKILLGRIMPETLRVGDQYDLDGRISFSGKISSPFSFSKTFFQRLRLTGESVFQLQLNHPCFFLYKRNTPNALFFRQARPICSRRQPVHFGGTFL